MKRFTGLKVAAAAAALVLTATACGNGGSTGSSSSGDAGAKKKIEILQFVTHDALDATNKGFLKGLEANGFPADSLEINQLNGAGDNSNVTQMATKISQSNPDLVFAIATPAAQAVANTVKTAPILFTAVTDPVGAKLVKSLEAPGGNVTGTSDANPVKEQLELIKQLKPEAKTVGIVYSSAESNSAVQVEWAKAAAAELGLTIEAKGISASSEVSQAASSLNVDAIYVPTDNAVVSAMASLVKVAEANKTLVIGAEAGTVKAGAVATVGINYEKLGEQTGVMASKILKGEAKPESMPVETQTEYDVYINETAAKNIGLTLPADLVAKAVEKY
ncbi:MAG: ABC transporter substrate-binding protein [Arthrobacter sp.]|jgi:putative ABC transport system substrate-binding protein|nr:ABC transporter substrate-binding protein [Arthrobacter sp.]